jgi:hypothetical protein
MHSHSVLHLKQRTMRIFLLNPTIFTLSLQFPLPYNWSLLLARLLTSSGIASSKRNARVAFGWCPSLLTFTVGYPAHPKLVFKHAPCLTFPVSILPRVQVISHSFFQKNTSTRLKNNPPPSSRSLHLVPTAQVLKPTESSCVQTTAHIGCRFE